MAVHMPAFSLYITDDRKAFIEAEAARLGVSQAKFVSLLIDSYRRKERAQLACVGKDRQAWTAGLSLDEAIRSHAQAVQVHPGLVVYLLPAGTTILTGEPLPEGATEHETGP